jgi:hypothetical protein
MLKNPRPKAMKNRVSNFSWLDTYAFDGEPPARPNAGGGFADLVGRLVMILVVIAMIVITVMVTMEEHDAVMIVVTVMMLDDHDLLLVIAIAVMVAIADADRNAFLREHHGLVSYGPSQGRRT